MRPALLLPFMALLTLPSLAQAAPMDIQAIVQPDGSLSACVAERAYDTGRKLSVLLTPQGALDLNVTIPNGGFTPNRRYDLNLRLDNTDPRRIRAKATSEQTLVFQLGAGEPIKKALAATSTLTIGASPSSDLAFALPPMQAVMQNLQLCLDAPQASQQPRQQPATPTPAPARVQAPAPTSQPTSSTTVDFPQPLHQLLKDAGLPAIEPLPMDDIPLDERPADYIWQVGNILGGVRERIVPQGHGLSQLMGLHTQGLKNKCPGTFRTDINKEQKQGTLTLRTAIASCAPAKGEKGDTILVGLVFYLTDKNVFTVFTHEGPDKTKKEILATRDKLATFFLTLAREEKN